MRQWMLKITAYADRLLDDLELVDWPESIKEMQRNWIGRSVGANIEFKVAGTDKSYTVFTTRPDTLFGATYSVLAPELDLVREITTPEQKAAVEAYIEETAKKSDLKRTDLAKEKQEYLLVLMQSIQLMARKSQSGSPIMYYLHTAQEPSWLFQHMMNVTLNSLKLSD